jgi:ABC-type Fe3+ transport system substrate-binding protein
MKVIRRSAISCLMAMAILSVLAASASSQAVSPKTSMAELIENAKKEGQLTLVWGEATLGGSVGVARMAELFNKAYGLDLKIRFTPGPSQSEMTGRLVEEFKAKQPATTDVFLTDASTMVPAIQAGALESVDWASWATNVKNPEQVFRHGLGLAVQTVVIGFTYNSDLLKGDSIPKSFEDLLSPKYTGKIAAPPYAGPFDRLAMREAWGPEKSIDFATNLSKQLSGLIRCGDTQRLVSGEFSILAPDCSQGPTLVAKAKGAPVDYMVPSDVHIIFYYALAIPKNAAHPNAAKLWANFMLSREAQDIIYASDGMDSHLVEGSKTLPFIQKYEKTGVRFLTLNLDQFEQNGMGELNEVKLRAARILSKK